MQTLPAGRRSGCDHFLCAQTSLKGGDCCPARRRLRPARRTPPSLKIRYSAETLHKATYLAIVQKLRYKVAFAARVHDEYTFYPSERYTTSRSEERRVGKECRSRWS